MEILLHLANQDGTCFEKFVDQDLILATTIIQHDGKWYTYKDHWFGQHYTKAVYIECRAPYQLT